MTAQVRSCLMLALGLCVTGCGAGARPDVGTPRGNASSVAKARAERTTPLGLQVDYEDENSVGMEQDRVGKWRWRGDRTECYFVTGNRCFITEKEACAAARCGKRGCEVDNDGAPARVMCQGDDATARANAEREAIKKRNEKAEGEFDDSKFRDKGNRRRPKPGDSVEVFGEGDDAEDGRRKNKRRRGSRRDKKRGNRR